MSGQLWAVNSLGGYMYSDKLSDYMRTEVLPAVKMRQFCDAKDGMGGYGKGDTFHWNVYSKIASSGTTLNETNVMPESNVTIFERA